MSKNKKLIGVDLGGTKVNMGLVKGDKILARKYAKLPRNTKSRQEVVQLIVDLIAELIVEEQVNGIGIGVPGILDSDKNIVYEVQNIAHWDEVPLARILEKEFKVPVFLDNDANCFALAQYHFGQCRGCENFVGITLGTGMGSGIITNGHLMGDANSGSGEFGMIAYKDGVIEDYCSGKFFKKHYNSNGEELMQRAELADKEALEAFTAFGKHLGNAIKTIMYAVNPQKIIIGGSVVHSLPFFETSLKKSIADFAYRKVLENFEILYSDTPDIAITGAASLYYDRKN